MKQFVKHAQSNVLTCTKVIVIFIALVFAPDIHAQFVSGSGSPTDPYIIGDAAGLDAVRFNLNSHYRLNMDIDLTSFIATNYTTDGWLPIGSSLSAPFQGSFDGAGYKITGLWINRPNDDNVGLFGYTMNNGSDVTIQNLGIEIASAGITGGNFVGGLVGYQRASYTGRNNTIMNCYTVGNVTATVNTVGGLVGKMHTTNGANCIISACYSRGSIYGEDGPVGGLTGEQLTEDASSNSLIENCYSSCNVTAPNSFPSPVGNGVGGLVGKQVTNNGSCTIKYCYATGNVTGYAMLGGLVGAQQNGGSIGNKYIDNCYSTGNVTGGGYDLGALVGYQDIAGCSIYESFRYEFARINGNVIDDDPFTNPQHGRNLRDGSTDDATADHFMNQDIYDNNSWDFSASGPWHWDNSTKFPMLNMRDEQYPFPFYAITYNTAGASLPSTVKYTYERGETYALPNLIMPGYRFDGWFNSSNSPVSRINSTDTGHKVFWAKWTMLVAPRITGSSSMTLNRGYTATSTDAFTISGTTPVTVKKLSGNEHITWNNSTRQLDIAEGLAIGVYEVRLQASNSVSSFNFTFTLTVEERVYYVGVALSYEGGSVEALTNVPYLAIEGETVTLIITPHEGYELVDIYVVDYNNGNILVPLSGTGLTRTFTMPAHNITVIAVFRVIRVSIDDIETNGLKAYVVQHGTLYITGLKAGIPWNVYNLNGTPVYQGIARGEEVDVVLPGRGVYIVTNGNHSVKVIY